MCNICAICFEANPNEELQCNHYFHSECINRWRQMSDSCPMCRDNARINDIRDIFSNLSDDDFSTYTCLNKQFNPINVQKYTNPEITEAEINYVKRFSNKTNIESISIDEINRNIIIYIPKNSGNNIHLGKAIIENENIVFNNSYVISRTSAHTYKTSPLIRYYKLHENDLFYKVT